MPPFGGIAFHEKKHPAAGPGFSGSFGYFRTRILMFLNRPCPHGPGDRSSPRSSRSGHLRHLLLATFAFQSSAPISASAVFSPLSQGSTWAP